MSNISEAVNAGEGADHCIDYGDGCPPNKEHVANTLFRACGSQTLCKETFVPTKPRGRINDECIAKGVSLSSSKDALLKVFSGCSPKTRKKVCRFIAEVAPIEENSGVINQTTSRVSHLTWWPAREDSWASVHIVKFEEGFTDE